LRSEKSIPPIVKVMNYRKNLIKKILAGLGKKKEEIDEKPKILSLTSSISHHDLENKK